MIKLVFVFNKHLKFCKWNRRWLTWFLSVRVCVDRMKSKIQWVELRVLIAFSLNKIDNFCIWCWTVIGFVEFVELLFGSKWRLIRSKVVGEVFWVMNDEFVVRCEWREKVGLRRGFMLTNNEMDELSFFLLYQLQFGLKLMFVRGLGQPYVWE